MSHDLYMVSGHDNDLFFFDERIDVARCPVCVQLTRKWDEDLSAVPLNGMRRLDLSTSYDGVTVVSEKFQRTCEEGGVVGMRFVPLAAKGFAVAMPTRTVEFDIQRGETRFSKQCSRCGQFESVTGGNPVSLVAPVSVEKREFVRTDLEFGSADEKSPLIICGATAAAVLRGAKLKGMDLDKIEP